MMKKVRRMLALIAALMIVYAFPVAANAADGDVATAEEFILAVYNKASVINITAPISTTADLTIDSNTTVTFGIGGSWTIAGGSVTVYGGISGGVSGNYTQYIPASSFSNWPSGVSGVAYVGFENNTSTRDIVTHNGTVYLNSACTSRTITVIETTSGAVYKLSSGGGLSKVHAITYVEPEDNNVITSATPAEFLEADGATLPTGEPYRKAGYTFLGWATDSAATAANITAVAPGTSSSVIVYAIWQADAPAGGGTGGAMPGGVGGTLAGAVSAMGGGGGGSAAGAATAANTSDDDDDDESSASQTSPSMQQQVRVVRANSSTKVSFKDGAALDMAMPTVDGNERPTVPATIYIIVGALLLGLVVFGILRYNKHVNDTWTDEDDDTEFHLAK